MNADIHIQATKRVRRFFGHFPQVVSARARMVAAIESPSRGEEPEHLMLLGDPGTGKSTLLTWISKSYPPKDHEEFTEIPVLYVEVPAACTIKKLAGAMLQAIGSPFWNKGTEEDRTFQLRTLLRECRTRVVILDEVNHLVDRGQAKSHEAVADWIKQLSTQSKVAFVLAGIARSRALLEANDQLADRFREVLEVRPFGVGTKDQTAEFAAVMKAFEQAMQGVKHVDLSADDVLRPLAFATAGRLRAIRKLLVRAIELVAKTSSSGRSAGIDLSILEQAFLEVIFKKAKPEQNPFSPKFRGTPLIKAGEPFAPSSR